MRQLFALIIVLGPAIGIAFSTGSFGIGFACVYSVITLGVLLVFARTAKSWSTESNIRRSYGVVLSTVIAFIWIAFVASIITNPRIRSERMTADLKSELSNDERFKFLLVEYKESKINCLYVSGTLKSESDFQDLCDIISRREWHDMDGVFWNLNVITPARKIDKLDYEVVHRYRT